MERSRKNTLGISFYFFAVVGHWYLDLKLPVLRNGLKKKPVTQYAIPAPADSHCDLLREFYNRTHLKSRYQSNTVAYFSPYTLKLDLNLFMLLVATTVAASCAFMLPVAILPNAVVFGSGYLPIPDMVRTGI